MQNILMNTEMTKAILDCRKVQFREVIQLAFDDGVNNYRKDDNTNLWLAFKDDEWITSIIPKYNIGNILWVSEPVKIELLHSANQRINFRYVADGSDGDILIPERFMQKAYPKWIQNCQGVPNGCIKEMARIFLKITDVRVELMENITLEDVIKEGFPCQHNLTKKELQKKVIDVDITDYKKKIDEEHIARWWIWLWDRTAPKGYQFWDNPYVFVDEFERVEK